MWNKTRIGEFLFAREGKYKPDSTAIGGLKRVEKIDFSGKFHIAQKPSKTDMILICSGDFVISGIGAHHGSMGIYQGHEDVTATIHYSSYTFDKSKINVDYFKRFLRSPQFMNLINKQVRGGMMPEIKAKHLLPLEIDLPNIKKQKEIVGRIKSIETEDGELKTEIIYQQTLIKKLRQQILQEAIEGKLTAEWRKRFSPLPRGRTSKQGEDKYEHASVLLERIIAEKNQMIKDKKIKSYKTLPPISDEDKPFHLPPGWVWCRLVDICRKTGSGSTPSGGKSAYVVEGIKFIRSQNVYNDGLRWDGEAYIPQKTHEKMNGTKLMPKDLLLNITGGSIGRCCIIPEIFESGNINQHVAIIRAVMTETRHFLHKVICSLFFQNAIIDAQTGAGREGLPKNRMDNMLIPFPPLAEQKAIVAKVEKLLALCDQLETKIIENKTHAEQLMRAVLKEALRGNSEI